MYHYWGFCVFDPPLRQFCLFCELFSGPGFATFTRNSMICIISVSWPLLWHIGEVRAPQWHYLHHYMWFWVFNPHLRQFCPFCDLYWALLSQSYIRTLWFVLLLLPDHFYDILAKLQLFNGIIRIIISWTVIHYSFYKNLGLGRADLYDVINCPNFS